MTHIDLDSSDPAVKQFILSLPADAEGAMLDSGGQTVARLVRLVSPAPEGSWDAAKDARRCELIDREIAGTLTTAEAAELAALQAAMLNHRRTVAPLPLDEARRLHRELLAKTGGGP